MKEHATRELTVSSVFIQLKSLFISVRVSGDCLTMIIKCQKHRDGSLAAMKGAHAHDAFDYSTPAANETGVRSLKLYIFAL